MPLLRGGIAPRLTETRWLPTLDRQALEGYRRVSVSPTRESRGAVPSLRLESVPVYPYVGTVCLWGNPPQAEFSVPAVDRNWNYYTYVSDDGTTYNVRADVEWAALAAHGLAARTNGAPRFIASAQQQPRKVRYSDPTTGRSKVGPIGTAAAYAALNLGDTEDFAVRGLAAAVSFAAIKKIGERVPVTQLAGPGLGDHA